MRNSQKKVSRKTVSLHNQKGQAMVESALFMFFFLAFVLTFGSLVKLSYSWLVLQHSVNKTMREVRLYDSTDFPIAEARVAEIAGKLGVNLDHEGDEVDIFLDIVENELVFTIDKTITIDPLLGVLLMIVGNEYTGEYQVNFTQRLKRDILITSEDFPIS